ncbi:hypothetical protein [Aeromonas salmonicida]|uniref:hypothetical protein n=1 Tax=Aeromonas salmonicida TaxID=645 RepID=UPI0036714094
MPLHIETGEHKTLVKISGEMTIYTAAKKTMQQGDSPLHLVMHSHAVLDALELCQLAAFFGDPTLIPHADHA